jgi:hypothetical protein
MWGSAASVMDVFFADGIEKPSDAAESVNHKFRRLLIRTADEMVAHGITASPCGSDRQCTSWAVHRL